MPLASLVALLLLAGPAAADGSLVWPIDCVPGGSCARIGYPDPDGDNRAFDCKRPSYRGHEGTDISVSRVHANGGVDVFAAAAGRVLWVFDGRFDGCPSDHADCAIPPDDWFVAGASNGVRVCTERGPWCREPERHGCFWCFDGGNVVVIRHEGIADVFATRYDHFKTGSILVAPGDTVEAGQKIGEVGSAGRSTAPHLHFEVWGRTFYDPVDPWLGRCSSKPRHRLWKNQPPWKAPKPERGGEPQP